MTLAGTVAQIVDAGGGRIAETPFDLSREKVGLAEAVDDVVGRRIGLVGLAGIERGAITFLEAGEELLGILGIGIVVREVHVGIAALLAVSLAEGLA